MRIGVCNYHPSSIRQPHAAMACRSRQRLPGDTACRSASAGPADRASREEGRRYRYYVSRPLITNDQTERSAGLRIPAGEMEQAVTEQHAGEQARLASARGKLGKQSVAGVLTTRPRCSVTFGWTSSAICASSRS